MNTAVIEVYYKDRGFGFAKMTDRNGIRINVFFHITGVVSGDPAPGSTMEFDISTGNPKGPVATNIRIKPPATPTPSAVAALSGGVR
jgi:cold shock CspA family protein